MRIGRVVHKADFGRLLGTRPCGRSAHFAVHHVLAGPSQPAPPSARRAPAMLSTEPGPVGAETVDKQPGGLWLGSVVPKRHARRAVTRTLIKRQIRGALERHASRLPPGLWLVRLQSAWPRDAFPSAASPALAHAARDELERLFGRWA